MSAMPRHLLDLTSSDLGVPAGAEMMHWAFRVIFSKMTGNSGSARGEP